MGLVGLMDSVDKGEARHDYEVTMYGAADEITPLLVKGEVDVALVPCNLASVLYNKMKETGGVEVAAINTLGVLYIVTTGDGITSVADLAGKTIYSTGKGTTPRQGWNGQKHRFGADGCGACRARAPCAFGRAGFRPSQRRLYCRRIRQNSI